MANLLISNSFEVLGGCGVRNVYLNANKNNEPAMNLYAKIGFKAINEIKRDSWYRLEWIIR